ncbi:hypothetical protein O8I61_07640, partial [Campylobacter lari]|uniref:hypothetical protein n=1 Tax=Campylobacter lari TaxID=201 RepID=UPI00372B5A63
NMTDQIPLGGKQSGNLINNGGTTNIVLRESGNNALGQAGISMFNVNTGGEATTNIVVEGSVNIGANINYGGYNSNDKYIIDGKWNQGWLGNDTNKTTLIFANGNDMNKDGGASKGQPKMENSKDSFASNSTDVKNGNAKVLGVTYKDGIKLVLQDKLIKTNDGKNASFLATYKSYFIQKDTDPILTITTQRESNSGFKDTIVVDGLLIGNVVALQRSEANKDKQATFDVTLKTNSVFFGGFDFSNLLKNGSAEAMGKDGESGMTNPLEKTSITLVMEKGSKFFTDSSVTLQSLSIKNASLNREETLRNTFSQSNTVIDLGSYGNDNNALLTRENFNLLSIGSVTQQTDTQ